MPLGLRGDRTVKAIVELSAPSVAEAEGDALEAGESLSSADKNSVRAAATTQQEAVATEVHEQGGAVEEGFSEAINALIAAQMRTEEQLARTEEQLARTDAQLARTDAKFERFIENLPPQRQRAQKLDHFLS